MLQSRPFSFAHARPPEGPAFAAERLVRYHGATGQPVDTAPMKETLAGLKAALAAEHPSAKLSHEDMIAISKGEKALPDHIRAAGPVKYRSGTMVRDRVAQLETIIGTADAHNEALTAGLNQLGPNAPKADNAGGSP